MEAHVTIIMSALRTTCAAKERVQVMILRALVNTDALKIRLEAVLHFPLLVANIIAAHLVLAPVSLGTPLMFPMIYYANLF